MTPQELKNIEINKVTVGQSFKTFNALCKSVGVEPKKGGKERKYIEKRLRCYFDWEKAEHSSKVTISAVYYDNPKAYEDERRGIHTTDENRLMQYLVLLTPALFEEDYGKRSMLIRMRLLTNENPYYRTRVYWNYESKVRNLLESALNQLTKLGYIFAWPYLYSWQDECSLCLEEEIVYEEIFQHTLKEYGAKNVVIVDMKGLGEMFWKDVNKKCVKLLGYGRISTRYHLIQYCDKRQVLQMILDYFQYDEEERECMLHDPDCERKLRKMVYEELRQKVHENQVRNYRKTHEKAIGIADVAHYDSDLWEIQNRVA